MKNLEKLQKAQFRMKENNKLNYKMRKKTRLPIHLNSLFILILLSNLMWFTKECHLFVYQLFSFEMNYLFIIVSVALKLCVVFVCFFLYKKSVLKKLNSIVPLLTIILTIYYMFFRGYHLATMLDSDEGYFVKLVTSNEVSISSHIGNVLVLLIYVFLFIRGVDFKIKKNFDPDESIIDSNR